ncbi:MAG: ribonuclease P protein subunit [Fervidicoccaceae archaeon]
MRLPTYSEILGAEAEVMSSADPSLNKRRGIIAGETKNTIILIEKGKELKLLKWNIVLRINPGRKDERVISGIDILGRPEERTKEILRTGKRWL